MIKPQRLLLSFGLLTLAGCEQVTAGGEWVVDHYDAPEPPSLTFLPGYQIDVEGQGVAIQGFDECPSEGALMSALFGSFALEGEFTCVVLSEGRSIVPVTLYLPSGPVVEEWQVFGEASDSRAIEDKEVWDRVTLKRPDGSFVMPFQGNGQ